MMRLLMIAQLTIGVLSHIKPATKLPPKAVFVDPLSFAVLGPNGTFRDSFSDKPLNPTLSTPPFFQVFDLGFVDILGEDATFNIISSNDSAASFATEAPVYVPETDEMFFSGSSSNVMSKISMVAIEKALRLVRGNNITTVNVPATPINLPTFIPQIAGGSGPLKSSLVFVNFGTETVPPSVALVNYKSPYNATVLLDNFYGRPFNSLDDVRIHPNSEAIFFTDPSFGFLVQRRPLPQLPNQVYRLDATTGAVSVVATDFQQCNGLAFSRDGKHAFVTDTGAFISFNSTDRTRTATIYKFDVELRSQVFTNKRVFAYIDTGIPDGILVDATGNVYAGCGDGVSVWSPVGVLLGKFFTGVTTANMAFAGDGRLVILGGKVIYMAKIAAKAGKTAYP